MVKIEFYYHDITVSTFPSKFCINVPGNRCAIEAFHSVLPRCSAQRNEGAGKLAFIVLLTSKE